MNSWLVEIQWKLIDERSAGWEIELIELACSFERIF